MAFLWISDPPIGIKAILYLVMQKSVNVQKQLL